MSKPRSFTDADGDTYTVETHGSSTNMSISYQSPETAGTSFIIFKAEDADRLAAMILDAAQEAVK